MIELRGTDERAEREVFFVQLQTAQSLRFLHIVYGQGPQEMGRQNIEGHHLFVAPDGDDGAISAVQCGIEFKPSSGNKRRGNDRFDGKEIEPGAEPSEERPLPSLGEGRYLLVVSSQKGRGITCRMA